MTIVEIIRRLEALKNPQNINRMKLFEILPTKALGVSAPFLKRLAKQVKSQTKVRHQLLL